MKTHLTQKYPSQNLEMVQEYLSKLGFSEEEIMLYIALVKNGQSTLLEASKASGIDRSRLYRIVDDLIAKKIIEEVPAYKRRTIKACSINTIDLLIKEREQQNQYLNTTLPVFTNALQSLTKAVPKNNVIYYRGTEGIRQMTWNLLRAKGLARTYSHRFWDDILGTRFVVKLNEEMQRRDFTVHDLYSEEYLSFKKKWHKTHKQKPVGDWSFWDSRFISEEHVAINQNVDIYNDVVAYYYWEGEETFGVEIINERIANMQKQIHDTLWSMAVKRPELDWTKMWDENGMAVEY